MNPTFQLYVTLSEAKGLEILPLHYVQGQNDNGCGWMITSTASRKIGRRVIPAQAGIQAPGLLLPQEWHN